MRRPILTFAGALLIAALAFAAQARPLQVKVVVLTTFEVGADTGDRAGEFQLWAERFGFSRKLAVPGIEHPVLVSDDGVLGVVTGMRGRARESVAALALDPDLDLSHAYWLVAGIAGVDPRAGSLGSAAWANWVVDADPVFEIDDRETPADWPYGLYALNTDRPGLKGSVEGSSGMVWRLAPGLAAWAYQLTKDVPLPDTPQLEASRAAFAADPAAIKPPSVMMGDTVGTVRFWHGARRTQWARDWVKLWTDGQGRFVMTDCEDQGIMDVLDLYAKQGRVDIARVLVLRTASNYSQEPDGAAQVVQFHDGGFPASVEAAYRVGSPVVKALVAGWARYEQTPPGTAP